MGQEETNEKLEQPAAPKPAENTQKPKTCLLTSILLAILAIGGIAFGVYGMILANQPHKCPTVNYNVDEDSGSETTDAIEATCPDGTVTKVEKIIDNDLAQNLINPYMETFNFLSNLLDYPFDDSSKMGVTWRNLPVYDAVAESNGRYSVFYDVMNVKYQELFGTSKSLEKKDYTVGHSARFTYSDDSGVGVFSIEPNGGGGEGLSMFSIVKNASYNGKNIEVEVYHDVVPICYGADGDYCIDVELQAGSARLYIITSANEYNMQDLINNFSDQIPVYTMTFTQDNGHYVLTNVEKQ